MCTCVYSFWARHILTFTIASAAAVTGSVFMWRFRLFLGQCGANLRMAAYYARESHGYLFMAVHVGYFLDLQPT